MGGLVEPPGRARDGMMAGVRRRARTTWFTMALALTVLAVGCVGSVSRDTFDEEVQSRGGGLSQALVLEGVGAIEDELGRPPTLDAITAFREHVVVAVISPEFPDEIDRYVYRRGDLDGPDAVAETGSEPPRGFAPEDVALGRLDRLVDRAIETAGVRGGWADSMSVHRFSQGPAEIRVNVTNERRDVTVTYGPKGQLLEAP